MPPRQFPKLPFHLIDDHHPFGALYDIMMKCLQLKEARNVKQLEWQNPQQRMLLVSILGNVRSTLVKNGYPISPTVLFDESLPSDTVAELTSMVESMKGKVVKDRNAVGLTHIVYPFPNGEDPDDGEEYMRTQRRRGDKALVHRWYHPDSHNTWLEASVAPETIENDLEHLLPGPAKVSLRWVWVRSTAEAALNVEL
jgi:SWI/SNF related-matrix-associated actin-dependent regulator of chromatin subfamily C